MSVKNGGVIGYEALVRWNHPTLGLLLPSEFIPIAEESELIIHLGRWVLLEACSQMANWHQKFPVSPQPTISVNISPRHLRDSGLVKDVGRVLARTRLDPTCLKLEMTESSIMHNPETALDILGQLKLMHIGLEIDDFGTGYSSLSYLQRLPFDTVKIDRSFIKELGQRGESLEIVKTIVDLARSLEMEVVAEGVETREQLQKLTDLGCEYVQGYYFSKPVGKEPTEALMKERDDLRRAFALFEEAKLDLPVSIAEYGADAVATSVRRTS
jgi:EAL domain-containing protein (putative c-di-GMP-specific phosphodiesterase class I)